MPLPPETLVIASLVVAGAFIVFGLTGFGSTILAVPLLAHLLPLKFVIPMFVLLDFGAALRTGFKFHATIDKRELAWLAPSMLAGIAAGVFLLVSLPGELILTALGVFVLGYGAYAASGREPTLRLRRLWALPVGAFGARPRPGASARNYVSGLYHHHGHAHYLVRVRGALRTGRDTHFRRGSRAAHACRPMDRPPHARQPVAPAPAAGDRHSADTERWVAGRARFHVSIPPPSTRTA